ncbi:MAG TPA: hypothetical protein VMW27_13480 [Thermoanaerobaculia bacterium]|nr:hypothetical protein [Thermoanaerobaculia bacterium]
MKSVRPLCLAAALAALLLASAGPAAADDGIHLWKGLSSIGAPVFEMIESLWTYLAGAETMQSPATDKDGTTQNGSGPTPIPGGGCVDPNGNPITCPTNPKP